MRNQKRSMFWVLLSVLLFLHTAPAAHAKIYQIGLIMSKESKEDRKNREAAPQVMNATTQAFLDSKRFELIERARLDAIFTERDLQDFIEGKPGDLSDLEGVDMLGLVSFSTESGAPGTRNYYIDVRLFEVRTAKVYGTMTSRRDTFEAPSSPFQAGRYLLANIREMFPPEGIIIRISGKEVIIDLGVESAIQKGDELEVIREGEEIFHPVTGDPMPALENVVGVVKVVKPTNQMSTCKLLKADTKIGVMDRVRLRPKNERMRKIFNKVPFFKGKS